MDELIKLIVGWGPSGVIAAGAIYLWREERKERIEAQKIAQDIGNRSMEADFTIAKSMDELATSLDTFVRTVADQGPRR